MNRIAFGSFSLGLALCLPCWGVTYTAGDCSAANLIHRWSFNGDFTDSVGNLAATGVGTSFADNAVHTTGGGSSKSYVSLDPAALPKSGPFTVEIFATPKKIYSWSRIFSFGVGAPSSDPKNNMFMSWTRSTNQNQDQIRFIYGGTDAIQSNDTMQPFTVNTKWHIAFTYDPNGAANGRFFFSKTDLHGGNHRESAVNSATAVDFSTWGVDGFYLGRSYWSVDLDADADYDEVRVWNTALTAEQLMFSARLGADTLPTAASAGAETATIAVTAEAGGMVSLNGGAAGASGNATVAKNELVTLVATPDANYHFTGWTGDLWAIKSGTASDTSITVYAASAASFVASFRQNTATWTGAGDNNLWSTAANWQDSLLPVEHAQLVFNGDVRTTSQNDLVAQLDKLTFGTGAAAQTLSGNGLELLALENLSAATQTVDLAVSSSAELPIANSGNLVFNQAVTAPTLTLTGSGTTIFNQQGTSTTYNLDAGATMVFNGGLNGTAMDLLNGGTTYLNGTSTLGSLRLAKNGTTLTIDGTDTAITATGDLVGAQHIASGESTTININNGTVKLGTNLITDNSDGTGGGTTKAGGNGTINQSGGDVTVSQYFIVGRDHVGTYNFTGGAITQNKADTDSVFIGEIGGSAGTMNMSGDASLICAGNFQVGRYGTGVMNMSGGSATMKSWVTLGRMASGIGTMNVTGGKITQTKADRGFIIGELGKGTLNVSGTGVVDLAGVLSFSHSAANLTCEFNLTDGGTLKASGIRLSNTSPFASAYVDDATIVANGSGATLDNFINVPCLSVGPKGMTLDTQNNTVIVNRGFGAGASGASITKTGSGTLCMPASSALPVKVQEGALAGLPATAGGSVDGNLAAHLLHRWSFNGNFTDSVGGLDATGVGTEFVDNAVHTTGGGKAASYVSLNPNALPKDRPFTIEIFATPKKTFSWSRIFSFGKGAPNSDHKDNLFMSWTRGTEVKNDQIRFICGGKDAFQVNDSLQPYTVGTKWHIALTYVPNVTADGKGRFFWSKTDLNGGNHREAVVLSATAVNLQTWGMDGFYLGRSYWSADLDAEADYDEVRIWDAALTSEQLIANAKLGPDILPGTELVHRWSFNGDAKDSIGGTTALLVDAVTQGEQMVTTTGGTTGSGYVNLGNNMLPTDGSPVTIEIWATPHSRAFWGRVFDIGSNNGNYLTHAWSYQQQDARDLVEIKKNGTALISNQYTLFGYTLNTEYHYAFTITPVAGGKATVTWARRDARTGALIKQGSATTSAAWSVADIAGGPFYLGHSQYYPTDHNANASYNEVRVWKGVLTDAQLSRSAALGPDVLPTESAGAIAAVELAAGTSFTARSGEAAVGKLGGTGTVSGSVAVTDTLDIAGEDVGTMTLNGDLAVKGTWLLDMDASDCDSLTGTGALDISQATIAVRDRAKLRGGLVLATVGEVVGAKEATVAIKGYKLSCRDGRLVLASDGLQVIIR